MDGHRSDVVCSKNNISIIYYTARTLLAFVRQVEQEFVEFETNKLSRQPDSIH